MTTSLTLTELEAVNLMLAVIGEAPVSSLVVPGLADLTLARAILDETVREVQERGWEFNTETDYPLARDVSNFIAVPSNVLKLEIANASKHLDCVIRDTRLYDRGNHTFAFTENVKVNVTWLLSFPEMPQSARHYAAIRAARKFQRRMLGLDSLDKLSEAEEMQALDALLQQTGLPTGVLNEVSREVQEKGWEFNTDTDYTLNRDVTNFIPVPSNLLKFEPANASKHLDVVIRNGKLYDRSNHTYTFSENVVGHAVWLLTVVDLPMAARNYIQLRALRRFHRLLGLTQERFTEQDELNALNSLLQQTGLPSNVLSEVSREVQEKGWTFNTERDYPLTRDGDGYIVIPNNVLRVDTMNDSADLDVTVRDGKLYDRTAHSFVFTVDVRVEIVWLLKFSELPEAARNYIRIRALRRFHRLLGIPQERYTEQEEFTALAALQDQDCDAGDYNLLTGNYDVYRILER
jgi:hypothetical protein